MIDGNVRYRREIEGILGEPFRPPRHLPRLVWRRGIDAKKLILCQDRESEPAFNRIDKPISNGEKSHL